ncbi:hypothetical protein NDU88_002200 [Pleurodeles waltl]|uniref:Uncharacterized protein n=1 Tax=Pleurodeles waltl TaxID=8319 RepID=A0AAV7M1G6_PLEWA|nr:hypothetical protein NDU88_002200 [Pleurodeles waltl]
MPFLIPPVCSRSDRRLSADRQGQNEGLNPKAAKGLLEVAREQCKPKVQADRHGRAWSDGPGHDGAERAQLRPVQNMAGAHAPSTTADVTGVRQGPEEWGKWCWRRPLHPPGPGSNEERGV